MTEVVKAADLPEGSVLATNQETWIKHYPHSNAPWIGSSDKSDDQVDALLDSGAVVLRHGYSKGGIH